MKKTRELRECARRAAELASRCLDQDIAKILLDVADELDDEACWIENGPPEGAIQNTGLETRHLVRQQERRAQQFAGSSIPDRLEISSYCKAAEDECESTGLHQSS